MSSSFSRFVDCAFSEGVGSSTLTNAGATQLNSTLTVGADDQGYDIIFYGDTASANMTWDTSVDDLILNKLSWKLFDF